MPLRICGGAFLCRKKMRRRRPRGRVRWAAPGGGGGSVAARAGLRRGLQVWGAAEAHWREGMRKKRLSACRFPDGRRLDETFGRTCTGGYARVLTAIRRGEASLNCICTASGSQTRAGADKKSVRPRSHTDRIHLAIRTRIVCSFFGSGLGTCPGGFSARPDLTPQRTHHSDRLAGPLTPFRLRTDPHEPSSLIQLE